MKCTLPEAARLTELTGWAIQATPGRPTIPVLSGVKLTVYKDGAVSAEAFDYVISAYAELPAGTATDCVAGSVLVSGKRLDSLARKLPGSRPVTIEVTGGGQLSIECGTFSCLLTTMPLDEYPALPEVPDPGWLADGDWLSNAIRRVGHAAGSDDTLPVLTGIRMILGAGGAVIHGTDRYRLGEAKVEWVETSAADEVEVIVPAVALGKWRAACPPGEKIAIAVAANPATGEPGRLCLSAPGRSLTLDLIGGHDYPKCGQLLDNFFPEPEKGQEPDANRHRLVVSADDFLPALQRVGEVISERHGMVLLDIKRDAVAVTTYQEGDKSTELVEAAYKGPEMTIKFNPVYLMEAVKAATDGISDDAVVNVLTSEGKPVLITSCDGTDAYRVLLMPVPN